MIEPTLDVIDTILGSDAAAEVAPLRGLKPELNQQLQAYYDSIFLPAADSEAELSSVLRYLLAARVAAHTDSDEAVAWYLQQARNAGADEATAQRAIDLTDAFEAETKLGAGVRRVDLVTTEPGETSKEDLQELADAGYSPNGILALSQVIAFVSYQVRLIAGLRALGGRE